MSTRMVQLLLVEDDLVDVMAVKRALATLKVANPLQVCPDGVAGLEWLRARESNAPRVIVLLDLNLPRMNGIEFLEKVREDPQLRSLIVFVLTTSSAEKDRVAAYSHNVAGYIVKSEVGRDFLKVVTLLDHYWRVVELPDV